MEKSNVTPLKPKNKNDEKNESLVSSLSPREIVSELDRFVVGQNKAKKAVAVALRNRWRRLIFVKIKQYKSDFIFESVF